MVSACAAGRMADVNGVLEIEVCGHRREVAGVVVHVVAVARLGGPPVAAPVIRDGKESGFVHGLRPLRRLVAASWAICFPGTA